MMDEALNIDELKLEIKHIQGFPAGTRVHTDKGIVPIQEIKVGDMVLSKPESGEGELCYKLVVRTVSYEDKEIWDLWYFEINANTDISKLHKGKLLQLSRKGKMLSNVATPNHPFWVKGVGWTRLDELKNGQIIETYDSETIALVFMVNPLRKTSMQNVAGSYHPSNIFDADKKGFEIEDVEFFSLVEYGSEGLIRMVGNGNQPSPINVDGENIDIYSELFSLSVYNFEVSDHHSYFISQKGLWVHNTNCAQATPDLSPKNLVTCSGDSRPTKDTQGRSVDV